MKRWLHLVVVLFFISACIPGLQTQLSPGFLQPTAPNTDVLATIIPSPVPPTISPALKPTQTSTLPQLTYTLDPVLPQALIEGWVPPAGLVPAAIPEAADISIRPTPDGYTQWIYALTAPFPTLLEDVSFIEITQTWQGQINQRPLMMSQNTHAVLSAAWGASSAPGILTFPDDRQVLEAAWQQENALAIVPFEALEPRWKVLHVDGQSPLDQNLNPADYPLTVTFGILASQAAMDALNSGSLAIQPLPATNRDVDKMTVVMMTGTTALVRATAYVMNVQGVDFPARDVLPWLQTADLVHVSNESSLNPDCPMPDAYDSSLRFCSDPAHIDLFTALGADIIELSGNHLADYGHEAFGLTMQMLSERGFQYYAAGNNAESARQALLVEHHGNRLAFIGCNSAGPPNVWATADRLGTAQCDMEWLASEVTRLSDAGYLVIVTFQYQESMGSMPTPQELNDFRSMAEAGAVIVSGSQAHYPMIMEFYRDAFIHYGLGNFIFDQMFELGVRQEFLDRHVFYNGKYISSEIYTAMLEDYARPRPMSPEERAEFLTRIYQDSGW